MLIPLAAPGLAQVDSAQRGAQLLGCNLPPEFAGAVRQGHRVGTLLQALTPYGESVAVPVEDLQPIAESNEILHTDWASWLSSTVGILYMARNCAYCDEQCMAVRRWFMCKRAEPYLESCQRGWSKAQSVEE